MLTTIAIGSPRPRSLSSKNAFGSVNSVVAELIR
jgi:hypothetical protein